MDDARVLPELSRTILAGTRRSETPFPPCDRFSALKRKKKRYPRDKKWRAGIFCNNNIERFRDYRRSTDNIGRTFCAREIPLKKIQDYTCARAHVCRRGKSIHFAISRGNLRRNIDARAERVNCAAYTGGMEIGFAIHQLTVKQSTDEYGWLSSAR